MQNFLCSTLTLTEDKNAKGGYLLRGWSLTVYRTLFEGTKKECTAFAKGYKAGVEALNNKVELGF